MPFSDRFHRQHEQATATIGELRHLVRGHQPGTDAVAIAVQLARLFSALRVHFAEEDACLVRALIETGDGAAAALAARHQEDSGSLAWDWEEYMQRWSSSAVIALNFAAFAAALERLLGALEERIRQEEATLYPVADALFSDLQGKAA